MRNRRRLWAVLIPGLVIMSIAVAGFVLARTGLPDNRMFSGDESAAAAVLGRPLPEPRFLPQGMKRSGIGVDPANTPTGVRRVTVSYAISGQNVALLTLVRGSMGRADGTVTTIGDVAAPVSTRTIYDGSSDVQYVWDRDGIGYNLHVNLVKGLTRELSDRIVESVH